MKAISRILPATVFLAAASFPLLAAAPSEPVVIHRGAHHRSMQTITPQVSVSGRTILATNTYTELATGMHWMDEAGNWIESREVIEPAPGGAVAHQGALKAAWAANLNSPIVLEVLTPDGKRFKSRLLGIAFTATDGRSALIAEPKDCLGQIIGNQILYQDAFAGPFRADVRFTYTLAGLSQEVLIREAVPSPAEYNLGDPARVRMEIWTEFLEAPAPVVVRTVLKVETDLLARQGALEPDLIDESLDFGLLRIGLGKGFPLERAQADFFDEAVEVGKSWVQIPEGNTFRTFLIEKINYEEAREHLEALPKAAALNHRGKEQRQAAKRAARREELLADLLRPAGREAGAANGPMRLAAAMPAEKGFNFDYESLLVNTNDFIFKSDSTYFIRANVNLAGTTVLESAVLKFTNGNAAAKLTIQGTLDCRTDRYRPAVFTGKDDNSIGEPIAGSTGNPTTNYYGYYLDIGGNTNVIDLHDVRMRRGYYGVTMNNSSKLVLRNAQISSNYTAIVIINGQVRLRNALIQDATYAYGGAGTNNSGEHVTYHRLNFLRSSSGSSYNTFLTNCLIVSVTNLVLYTGANVVSNLHDTGFFQTVGGGAHYLAADSAHRNAGTTNINPDLLAQLKERTTFPPVMLTNSILSDLTLSPQAQRDTDTPDIGYLYEPLDYLVSGVTIASNVTVLATNGVAIGIDYSQSSWGFILDSARFVSEGSALALNHIVRAHTVQERFTGNPTPRAVFHDNSDAYEGAPPALCQARFRFTEFAQLSDDGYLLNTGQGFSALEWTHSRIYNPSLVIDTSGNGVLVCGLTNTLWERGAVLFGLGTTGTNVIVHLRNNLARNLSGWQFLNGSNSWTIHDNLFDSVGVLTNHGSVVQNWTNAYYNTFWGLSSGVGNISMGSLIYETNSFGKYYQPTNSVLINKGTRTADLAQLFHFTTTLNQIKETNSFVDIGPHYVAINSSGQPLDTDGDGTPDYLEDADNDGLVDSGETDWQSYNSLNGLTGSPGLQVFTPLK